ncbi:response regulator transcription factor [Winogradskya consettensis]|uniref:DNA-binding response regulator n=1 Tax=Winogradskya consettensis TaxID=113560 RepID=A0A919SNQ1_9ACTN|nr:response regulator transcription factor [Actinoplanes consettensis]GIM76200.1 DNA-binding response regulator [Actinoplanes consettensis]
MGAHVVIAEDDLRQAEVVRRYLEASGYSASVVHGGVDAIEEVRRSRPDLLVLDVMMPQLNGVEVCRVLRRESNVPVLMLTARRDEDDLLLGLDAGADDYLMKPYNPRELMARVRTMLRRTRWTPVEPETTLRVGEIVVDVLGHHVTSGGRRVDCTPGEFEILAAMAAAPDRVFTRAQLLERTRGFETAATDRTVDMHVMKLRRKIEPNPRRPACLVTVYGVGYKLTDGSR